MSNPTRSATLTQARKWLGTAEHPSGSNRTPIGERFGWNGVPWCAESVCVVLLDSGWKVKKNAGAWSLGRQLVSMPGWKRVAPDSIASGDIVVFEFSHIGICEARKDADHLITLEGNVGNAFKRMVRAESTIAYGVRPPYAVEAAKPKPKPAKPKHHATLELGSHGGEVDDLQRYLISKGYSCGRWGADGDFGPATRAAVIRYQTRRLPRYIGRENQWDGIVGPRTWALIDAKK